MARVPAESHHRHRKLAIMTAVGVSLILSGCGKSTGTNNTNGGGGGGGGPVNTNALSPNAVTVTSSNVTTANITVPGSAPLVIHLFGASSSGQVTATNTVTIVSSGTWQAFAVGDNLSPNDTWTFSGSQGSSGTAANNDVTIVPGTLVTTTPQGTTFGSTGVSFQFTVPAGSSGQRNLQVTDSNGNTSVFTGAILIQ